MQDTPQHAPSGVSGSPTASGTGGDARARFLAAFQASLADRSFAKLVLAGYRGPEPDLNRVAVRPVTLKDRDCLSFVSSHTTRDVTRNLPLPEGLAALDDMIAGSFGHAHLLTTAGEIELRVSRKGKATLLRGGASPAAAPAEVSSGAHNREKQRWVDPARPFLQALGVTDTQHAVVPSMSRKWKQINKFVEVFAHALEASPLLKDRPSEDAARPVHVADFGSGKGYLTFAVHDHLRHTLGLGDAEVTGVELRPDMVGLCRQVVRRLGIEGLRFDEGDVRTYTPPAIDVMIALHACDTATDHAIHLGLRAGASIIMCSPCCHKQIRPQLLSPHPLRPILQHGVHLGQEAEMLTDGLRALLLEAAGYDTQVFEFIALEHTNKNKMILAVKRMQQPAGRSEEVQAQIREIKAFYGIREHCLETLLMQPSQDRIGD
jgi:hypothetical protein